MIQTDLHVEGLFHSLALHRFNIHKEEVKRALLPLLHEVYRLGYDRGVADHSNNLHEVEVEKCESLSPEQPELSDDTLLEN